ncbi:DNA polymerase III subunit alpha [Planctomycetota bacterium]|nr:DNA polymerase III subunit alpha [Planctomycetota bacterium]
MDQSDFVHLHVHSDYSLLDGVAKTPKLIKKTVECGQQAIAITDHGTVSGAIEFYKAAKKAGVKPILGCEIYQSLGPMTKRVRGYNHLTVLAKNDVGWKNLSRITSIANLEGFYYRPRVDFETLAKNSEGLVILSGCLKGPVPVKLQQDKYQEAKEEAKKFKEIWGDDYYLEIQPNSLEQQKVVNKGCRDLAKELDIRTVATCDLHYIDKEDAAAQEIRICISSGKTLSDQNRLQMKNDFYFHSSEEMQRAFKDCPEAILATREIAEKVTDYDLMPGADRNEYFLPHFLPPDGSTPDEYFDSQCWAGMIERYGLEPSKQARERLDYEKDVIRTLGFVNYFLITADFIMWAKNHECPVGPGRGSAAGSIVAYVLGITDIDPLRYDLLFERFLNPARVSMPDIDVDFCERNRPRVIEYTRDKYGTENVCQIVTFGTLKPKAVIKDVGRVMEVPFADVDRISKLIPDGPKLKNLEQAFRESPDLAALRHEPQYERMFDMALRLEGINRHRGKHAAGVVIADKNLIERIPVTLVKGDKTTEFTMTEVEEVGLLKMDFLGLRTLTLIEDAVTLIRKTGDDPKWHVDNEGLEDKPTFDMLSRAESKGVFQLESSGFRALLKRAKPDRFEDIIALIALYRPGPLGSGMDEQYVNRKHGHEPITYLTDLLAPILSETYGCILYQEQVMRIANQVAGMSMSDADTLRKAMGKKKLKLMEEYQPAFVAGFLAKDVPKEVAEEVWSQIAFFAEYGFNKSHSAAYGLVTYRTAWLKAHYPAEFMAATLTSWLGDTDRVLDYKTECDRMEIQVIPPDVNTSDVKFDVREGKIVYGLAAIKGLGEAVVEAIVEARKKQDNDRFRSLFHFCEEVEHKALSKGVLEALIKAGAFDSLGFKRRQLFEVTEDALKIGLQAQKDRMSNQTSLFGGATEQANMAKVEDELLPNVPEWPDAELLAHEKAAVGFYLTCHPLETHKETIQRYATTQVSDLPGMNEKATVTIGALLTGMRTLIDKKGKTMAFLTVEDFTGSVDCVVFGSVFAEFRQHLQGDAIVLIQGKVSLKREAPSILVDKVMPIETAGEAGLRVAVSAELILEETTEAMIPKMREVLMKHRGNDLVYYSVRRKSDEAVAGPFRVSPQLKVKGGDALAEELLEVLGPSTRVHIGAAL